MLVTYLRQTKPWQHSLTYQPVIVSRRGIFKWSTNHIIDPLRGICEHFYNHPLSVTGTVFCIIWSCYGLREYGSRKIMYQPEIKLFPTWKAMLYNVEYKEVVFSNIYDRNIDLHGLYIKGHNQELSNYPLLFLHGNAGNIAHRIENLLLLHNHIGCDIFIFDYRGYGQSSQVQPTQIGLIEDTISAMKQFIDIEQKPNMKPIIFGRSLGGAVAIHSIYKIIQQCDINIGGVIIENSFTSAWHCVDNNFLYPLIADKWNNMQCLNQLSKNGIDIPFLFISAVNDTILDPKMMQNMKDYCQQDLQFADISWKEFQSDHNDTFLCPDYTEIIYTFFESISKH